MMSEGSLGNRPGAPGINTKSSSLTHTAADLEILKEIENVYFSDPSEFDAARHVLESVPSPPTCEGIQAMFDKLKRQQQVVSSKALHLISQQRDNCDREFNSVQIIRDEITSTLNTCREIRTELKNASNHLTVTAFVILANHRKRQIIRSVLQALELLQNLRSVEKEVQDLMMKKDYEVAIELILKNKKAAALHKEYHCIKDLAIRLQEVLEMTEEKLDMVLSEICFKFDEKTFRRVRRAYSLLGKTQSAMEQLHMHYSSAVTKTALDAIKPFASNADGKFQDLCNTVPLNKAPNCLLNLCENLFFVMKSYKLLVDWHTLHDTEATIEGNVTVEIENNVSREYIRQKLKSGLIRLWNDVQGKVSCFLKCIGLEEYPFEKFIQMLGVLRRLTQVAEVFCGDTADILQDFIKTQSISYIKNYHSGRIEELRLFLENEGWELCPVKSNFTILNLQEFKQFRHYIKTDTNMSIAKSISDGASSNHSQDDNYINKVFLTKSNRSPFEIFRDETITNDDIFGLEPEAVDSESDDEPDELKRDYVDEDATEPLTKVTITNTTLSVLRNCGQYMQICRFLPQISLEVIMLMNQLFDYYFNCVHLFFTSDLEVSSNTLYSNRLNLALKRISNSLNSSDGKGFNSPSLPEHFLMKDEANLHGLSERIVAVESVIFLAKQYEILQPYLESIVATHQIIILNHFRDNTLVICEDLRVPVYMCSASKAFDAKSILISMSQVKWDMKGVAEVHSPYVDIIIRQIQIFASRLDNINAKLPLNSDVSTSIWAMVSKFVSHVLVEGFSNATKCSNGGRGLMQLDYRQLFVKMEKICKLKPLPYQEYVDRYVKAFYLPRNELEVFISERQEYSNKHLLALVACACENKRDRNELTALIENKN